MQRIENISVYTKIKNICIMNFLKGITCFILLCILILSSACSDEDDSFSAVKSKHLPITIESNGDISSTSVHYTYDTQNRLTNILKKESFYDNSMDDSEIRIEIIYDEQGKISQMVRTLDTGDVNGLIQDTVSYYYHGLSIAVNQPSGATMIEQDTKGNVVSYRYNPDTEKKSQKVYFISENYKYDGYGNIIQSRIVDQNGKIINDIAYTYDAYNGIFKDVNIPQWFLTTQIKEVLNYENNYKEKKVIGNEGENLISVASYKYNNAGYPVSESIYFKGYSLAIDIFPTHIKYKEVY
ncbi:MAG: hypothetical protein ACLVKO_01190 [Dysgonomonas sp.]